MDLKHLYTQVSSFLAHHELIALGLVAALALFLWKKPWEFAKFTLVAAALLTALYAASFLGNSANFGIQSKHSITTDREENLFGK